VSVGKAAGASGEAFVAGAAVDGTVWGVVAAGGAESERVCRGLPEATWAEAIPGVAMLAANITRANIRSVADHRVVIARARVANTGGGDSPEIGLYAG
jgi:hypothetical protein